ncbi:microcephalin isoform X1 [Hippocampus comes]|nr:PREDICTED: microcephalin isoform X1 [Hippocampus comes]
MTTSNSGTVFKDVVAYVDVWSSDKRANYSKPFIEQLQKMGAQVSKTFNKQVTHVVFNNGHAATWKKAKKSHVKLVSVLWIGKCHDDAVLVDEELYPAVIDESNLVLRNKQHRCMQPRDCPERTPENDRRMKKKLDKLMKDIAPKQTMVTDDSPFVIDEDSGIVYSPACKRTDYMAERLKHMKEKRENISPTVSQMSSSPGVKPSLENSPTVFRFFYENSDEDSSASVAELGHVPDKEKDCKESDVTEQNSPDKPFSKDLAKPWLSPCRDISKRPSFSPLTCPDFTINEVEGKTPEKQRMTSGTKSLIEKPKSVGEAQSLGEEVKSADDEHASKRKRTSQMHSCSSLNKMLEQTIDKSDEGRQSNHWAEVKNSKIASSCGNMFGGMLFNDHRQRKRTQGRRSLSTLAFSYSSSTNSRKVALNSPDGDDDVFDDFFSSASHHKNPKRHLLPVFPDLTDFDIPTELDYVPKKGKQRRCKSALTGTNGSKKRKLDDSEHICMPQPVLNAYPQNDFKENLPAFDHPNGTRTLAAKGRKQSTLPFVVASEAASGLQKASVFVDPAKLTEKMTTLELESHSGVCQLCHTFQSRGSESSAPVTSTEIPKDNQGKPNKRPCSFFQKISRAKSVRTLVMTSMPTQKQNTVVQVVKALGGFSIVDRVCESTTHVVSGEHRRTLNVLLGIARGCWILSFEWIVWCLEQRQWVPEEPYELSEQFPAAQICRLQKHLSFGDHYQQDLFQDQPPMFVSQHSQPPAPSLVELIQLCGGRVCNSVRQAGICIGRYSGRRPVGSRILSEQWVLDSITNLKNLSYDNYDLV